MIVALDALGIKKLWEPGQIFHENHPTILEIFNFAKQNQWTLATIGLDFKRCEAPIQLVQGILQRLGLKMPRLKRKGDGRKNKRVYIYGAPVADYVKADGKPVMDRNGFAIPLDDGREEIFQQWEARDLELRNKKLASEMEAAKALEEQRCWQEQEVENIISHSLYSKINLLLGWKPLLNIGLTQKP